MWSFQKVRGFKNGNILDNGVLKRKKDRKGMIKKKLNGKRFE